MKNSNSKAKAFFWVITFVISMLALVNTIDQDPFVSKWVLWVPAGLMIIACILQYWWSKAQKNFYWSQH